MANLKNLVAEAVKGIVINPPREREIGYHASSAGKCIRSVVVSRYLPKPLHEFSLETQSIFSIGHYVDKLFKESFERVVREGDVRIIAPFQTISFGDRHFPGVFGEGDVTLLDFSTKTIHWIDCKTTNHDSFFWKKTKGASQLNMLQVGTYVGSKQVQQLLQSLGWEKVRAWLVYIDKENYNHITCQADRTCVEDARTYWEVVKQVDGIYRETGDLPLATPEEDWECGYCNLWPGLPDIDWKNKTAVKNARSQLRVSNRTMCDQNGDTIFKNAINVGIKPGELNILESGDLNGKTRNEDSIS